MQYRLFKCTINFLEEMIQYLIDCEWKFLNTYHEEGILYGENYNNFLVN